MDRPRPEGLAGAAGRLAADPLRDEAAARNAGLPLLPAATAPAGLRRSAMGRSPAPASSPRLSAEKGRQKKGCDRAGNDYSALPTSQYTVRHGGRPIEGWAAGPPFLFLGPQNRTHQIGRAHV